MCLEFNEDRNTSLHMHTPNEVYSPNLSTVVLAMGVMSASDLKLLGHSEYPPNKVTSVSSGLRLKAVALCEHLDWSMEQNQCQNLKLLFSYIIWSRISVNILMCVVFFYFFHPM